MAKSTVFNRAVTVKIVGVVQCHRAAALGGAGGGHV